RAAARMRDEGVDATVLQADVTQPLPFADAAFDAAVSRLVLMIPADPAAALRGIARCVAPGGVLATAVWAHAAGHPWFAGARAAVAAAVGAGEASFARVFGRLGSSEELAAVHADAGLRVTSAVTLRDSVRAADAASQWASLVAENGHFTRLNDHLDADDRQRV